MSKIDGSTNLGAADRRRRLDELNAEYHAASMRLFNLSLVVALGTWFTAGFVVASLFYQ